MSFIEAIVLGIIQGLTEFLPVSSSGHLELGKAMLGSVPEEGMLMTILLHFATALSTIVIFRKDIAQIFKGLFQLKNNEELRFAIMILLSMIPAGFVGVFLESQIDSFFSGNIAMVGVMLLATGGLLFLADRARATEGKVTMAKALIIGLSQAIAILPGISRSGATIGTSVLLGIDRERAARFSFLMVIPLILGAMAVKTKDYLEIKELDDKSNYKTRTAFIVEQAKEDMPFIESDEVRLVLLAKERDWSDLKKGDVSCDCVQDELTERYSSNLERAGLSKQQIDHVLSNDFTKIRPFNRTSLWVYVAGFIAAFITGLFACTWMIALVKRSKLTYFAAYCFVVGVAAIVWTLI
jgi:undecaprenyl-diphosphatase